MSHKFGVFINMNYAHQSHSECAVIWKKIMDVMINSGFIFQKRAFTLFTDKSRDDVAADVRQLFDLLQKDQSNFYSYISDSYILDLKGCNDLTLPDTSDSIDVENITLQELDVMGIDYNFLTKNKTE